MGGTYTSTYGILILNNYEQIFRGQLLEEDKSLTTLERRKLNFIEEDNWTSVICYLLVKGRQLLQQP